MLEREPMSKIASTGKMFIYKHRSFWQCMDTLRDKLYLEKLWKKILNGKSGKIKKKIF